MTKKQTYTLYLPEDYIDKDDTVIARGLSAAEAMKVMFDYESGWKTSMHETDYGNFMHVVLRPPPISARPTRPSRNSCTPRCRRPATPSATGPSHST